MNFGSNFLKCVETDNNYYLLICAFILIVKLPEDSEKSSQTENKEALEKADEEKSEKQDNMVLIKHIFSFCISYNMFYCIKF